MNWWDELKKHHEQVRYVQLSGLFETDSDRANKYSIDVNGMYVDYSKNRVTDETMDLLFKLAESVELKLQIDAMFSGQKINTTEDRAVLHVALRAPKDRKFMVDGKNVSQDVHRVLRKMEDFSKTVRSGKWMGGSGKPIKNVVNLGIGGSNLGPQMVVTALKAYSHPEIRVDFVSNVDEADFIETTKGMDPVETLFIISSKSFTTDETMTNVKTARKWVCDSVGEDKVGHHFVAVSNNIEDARKFGISEDNIFEMWDWVGGRYSLGSAIGLSIITAIGLKNFRELLAGFHEVDEHFKTAPLNKNAPVILALLSVWYINYYGAQTEAILPYSAYLTQFADYFQQGNMESNGKSTLKNGEHVQRHTGPIVWGQAGTDGQHAFMQLLHQGTWLIPADFIGFIAPSGKSIEHHQKLLANMIAQSEALAFGLSEDELRKQGVDEKLIPHKRMYGDRPSNSILLPELSPRSLGKLIALYEHKIFVQGVIWDINSFDQYGVQLGKELAEKIFKDIHNPKSKPNHDVSTNALIKQLKDKSDKKPK